MIILDVVVNDYREGEHFFTCTPDDDILVPPSFLADIRLREDLWTTNSAQKLISLRSLVPAVQFDLDHNDALLTMSIEPEYFTLQNISNKRDNLPAPSRRFIYPNPFSAFFNYQIQATYLDTGFSYYSLPSEIGINWKQWLLHSSFQSGYNGNDLDFARSKTSLTLDSQEGMSRLILGDFNSRNTRLLQGGQFGGISWGSNFSLNRDFQPYPDSKLDTIIDTPTRAGLYRGGQLVKEWDLLPGAVSFSDLDLYGGSEASLLLKDIFGRERTLSLPELLRGHYVLRQGVHEYSHNLGFDRKYDIGQENDYGDLTFLGFHRYGLTDHFSSGIHYLLRDNLFNIGPMMGMRLGDHLFGMEAMYSSTDDSNGYALAFNHSFRWRKFQSNLSLSNYSRNFTRDFTESPYDSNAMNYVGNIGINYFLGGLGSLGFGYNEFCHWDDEPLAKATVNYQKNIFKPLTLSASLRIDVKGTNEKQLVVTLFYRPQDEDYRQYIDNIGYQFNKGTDEGNRHQLRMQKSSQSIDGIGYNFTVAQEEDGDLSGSARADYINKYGLFTTSFQNTLSGNSGYLSAAGGMGFLDGGLYFGRPITDSFAVVEVEGLDDVPIYYNNNYAGKVSDGDTILIPSLASYSENHLTVHAKDLPLNYELEEKHKYINIGQRSGTKIKIKGFKFTAVEGRVSLKGNTSPGMLTTVPIEIEALGKKIKSFTGENGYFYVENIPAGKSILHVSAGDRRCVARLNVPKSKDIIINMGDIKCSPIGDSLSSRIIINPVNIFKKKQTITMSSSTIRINRMIIR
ncbi:MAG: fimbria/pilus outer membrane usher protein [Desulfobulbaceae bacterium]|nr:fimbria/pilus outer membrane usher protein [Desulfobulbaceae bacterium]